MQEKKLYIISGCNGAGKTTASYNILPELLNCKEFVNADEIASGLSPFRPEIDSLLIYDNSKAESELIAEKEIDDKSFTIHNIQKFSILKIFAYEH